MSQQINLVNPLLLKKRYAFGLREMVLGLGGVLVATLAWGGFVHYQAAALDARATQQEAQQTAAQQEVDRLSAVAGRPVSALLTERVKATQVQVTQREALLASIGGLVDTSSSGFAARMRALAHGRIDGVWLNGFTLAHDHVALRGSALDAGLVTGYMERLGKQAAFAGLKLSGMNAQLAQPVAGGNPATPAVIDFELYSGSPDKPAQQEASHGQ